MNLETISVVSAQLYSMYSPSVYQTAVQTAWLCSELLGVEDGPITFRLSGYRKKFKVGEFGRPINRYDICHILDKTIGRSGGPSCPLFRWNQEHTAIIVTWQ